MRDEWLITDATDGSSLVAIHLLLVYMRNQSRMQNPVYQLYCIELLATVLIWRGLLLQLQLLALLIAEKSPGVYGLH